jgi:hypothetical protein
MQVQDYFPNLRNVHHKCNKDIFLSSFFLHCFLGLYEIKKQITRAIIPVPRCGDRGTIYCVKDYLGHYDRYGSRGLERGRAHPMDPKGFGNAIVIKTPTPLNDKKGS